MIFVSISLKSQGEYANLVRVALIKTKMEAATTRRRNMFLDIFSSGWSFTKF